MERHYEVLMVEAGSYFHHQSIGCQGAVSHILKGWRRSPHRVNSEDCGQDSLPYVFHGETLRGFDGGSRTPPTSTIKALGTRELCDTFWRDGVEAQTVSIQKIMDSLPYVFHGETLRGFDGGSRTPPASTIKTKTGYQREAWRILKGSSRSPNGVNSEDYGQPSIRFPWRNTTRLWWWKQGPTSTIKALGTRELCHTFWRDGVEAQTVSIQKIMDSLPYVFHGETLRGFDGGSRALLPPSKHWVPGSCVTHFEGMASKPKRCQFRRLWTAFHTFSMEKHYEALMVEAGPYFHHQSIGYQGAVSHILKGWRRSPNGVNSEDYGQPSIRFPWRNTTRLWWWKQGPTSTIKALGTRSCVTHFEGMASNPKPCQFRRLWTAFHTFSMEKHYDVLMVEAGSYSHHQSIGYQGAVSHILKGWRRSPHRVNSAIAAAVSTYNLQTKVDTPDQGVCYKRVLRLFVSLVISAASAVIGQLRKFEWSRTSEINIKLWPHCFTLQEGAGVHDSLVVVVLLFGLCCYMLLPCPSPEVHVKCLSEHRCLFSSNVCSFRNDPCDPQNPVFINGPTVFNMKLGGGLKNAVYFSSLPGGNDPIWLRCSNWIETTNVRKPHQRSGGARSAHHWVARGLGHVVLCWFFSEQCTKIGVVLPPKSSHV